MTLPQFADTCDEAIEVAQRAEKCGVDGVFVFDHLWPMGQKGKPALSAFPLLGAIASSTRRIFLGTLVARIGMLPDEVLVGEFQALEAIAPGRVIAGLGVGDSKSADENLSAGIGMAQAAERYTSLRYCVDQLVSDGKEVWLGGSSDEMISIARSTGAALNLWEGSPDALREFSESGVEVTWGGPIVSSPEDVPTDVNPKQVGILADLAQAGATWAVWGWPKSPEVVAKTARALVD
ncbi:MAG TPA: LLM class flavin-dependent oxidoreductase [Acidimicrobiales bacterium]|nr:LLM class flavin-dependent oxidoreductase [Acidimicrobiales bacterium]